MRFLLSIALLFSLFNTADAQLLKRRGTTTYSCANGKCTPVDNPLAAPIPEAKLPPPTIGDPDFPTGVIPDQLTQGYKINGKEVTRDEIVTKIGNAQSIPEFDKKWRAVVVGTTEARKVALDKIGVKDSVVVNAYDPSHFYAKDFRALVTLMRPDGEVVAEAASPADIGKVMKFTEVGPNDPQPAPPPEQPKPAPSPAPEPGPVAPSWLTWLNGILVAIGAAFAFLIKYVGPLARYFFPATDQSKIDELTKQLADLQKLVPQPLPATPGKWA